MTPPAPIGAKEDAMRRYWASNERVWGYWVPRIVRGETIADGHEQAEFVVVVMRFAAGMGLAMAYIEMWLGW